MSDSTTTQIKSSSLPSFKKLFKPSFWLGGNWKKEISKSNLPADIQTIIHQVVSKSRLMRREKFDVAEELVQHFQDGHRQGLAFESLTKDFGDPGSAAILIRRSKLRNRSLWVSAARMTMIAMACFSIAYLLLLWHYHSGQANPSIDYMAHFNQTAAEADEQDKAWTLYRPVWTRYQFIEGGRGTYADMREEALYVKDKDYRLARPSDDQWPQTVAMLKEHTELLDALREGAKRKSFGLELRSDPREYSDEDFKALFPNDEKSTYKNYYEEDDPDGILGGSTIAILLPHLQKMRDAARMLHVDTRHAVDVGDSNRVVENTETVSGLANQTAETPTLVNTLVAVAVASIGLEQLEEVMINDPDFLSKAQLARLQENLQKLNIRSWLAYKGERMFTKDTVQRCYTDDGNGDGRMTAAGMRFLNGPFFTAIVGLSGSGGNASIKEPPPIDWAKEWSRFKKYAFASQALAPATVFTCASRKEVLAKAEEMYDEIEADQKLPFWQSRNSKIDGWKKHNDFFEDQHIKHLLLYKVMPATQRVQQVMSRLTARRNGVVLALAIYRYHREHKKWPATAAELIGPYLNEVPVDILTGKPLMFKIVDDRPLIYSIGMDHDDDGGVDAQANGKSIDRESVNPGPRDDNFEGDWILWPQNAEG